MPSASCDTLLANTQAFIDISYPFAPSCLQLVREFLQPRLSGAGDVVHGLRANLTAGSSSSRGGSSSASGGIFMYVQHARDETDYHVQSLLDLRDGVRLAKLLCHLTRKSCYTSSLKPWRMVWVILAKPDMFICC